MSNEKSYKGWVSKPVAMRTTLRIHIPLQLHCCGTLNDNYHFEKC